MTAYKFIIYITVFLTTHLGNLMSVSLPIVKPASITYRCYIMPPLHFLLLSYPIDNKCFDSLSINLHKKREV